MCLFADRRRKFRGVVAYKVFRKEGGQYFSLVTNAGPYEIGTRYGATFPDDYSWGARVEHYLDQLIPGVPKNITVKFFHAYLNLGRTCGLMQHYDSRRYKILRVRLYGSGYEGYFEEAAAPEMELIEEVDEQ